MARIREKARLRNLELLVTEAGSAVKLAQLANTSPSYLSQIRRRLLTATGSSRGVGDRLAQKLERAMGKPHGWMDEPHAEALRRGSRDPGYGEPRPDVSTGLHPLISWADAAASRAAGAPARSETVEDLLPCPAPCSEQTFILRVSGESMESKFHDGELIYVDPEVAPESGRYVVVRLVGAAEATLRQLIVEGGSRYFKALNPDWPDRIVEASDEVSICGVVVFKGEVA